MLKKGLCLFWICLILCGCTRQPEKYTSEIFAMDTVMNLTVYGSDSSALQDAGRLISDLEKRLSVTDPESEISCLNQTGHAQLSEDTADLLSQALELCRQTDGILDLSIYPVVQAWGFTTGSYQIPRPDTLQALLDRVDYRQIQLSGRTVSLPDGMQIDLGSVAKGYTGDRLVSLFRERGISSALLNLGGNVQVLGTKPDGSLWRIGIQDPLSRDYLGILSVQDRAVITSGGYERYFEGPDGEIYWHIMDPSTGKPAKSGLLSATAVGTRGIACDALSTSLFIMGPEQAEAFWRQHRDFDMILVTEQMQVLITPNLSDCFRLTEHSPYTLRILDDAEN